MVPGLKNAVQVAYLLGDPSRKPLPVTAGEDGPVLTVPSNAPDAISSTVVLRIKGSASVESPVLLQAADGTLQLSAKDADVHGEQLRYEGGENHDNLGFWTNPADWAEWPVKITRPGKFTVTAEMAGYGLTTAVHQVVARARVLLGKA